MTKTAYKEAATLNDIIPALRNTVPAIYTPKERTETGSQSESMLEKALIGLMTKHDIEYVKIRNTAELAANTRKEVDRLNCTTLSDREWKQVYAALTNPNMTAMQKIEMMQNEPYVDITMDDGTRRTIMLVDKVNESRNSVQVVEQFACGKKDGARENSRYDVTVLINGIPSIHGELKKRSVEMMRAFKQTRRYVNGSFSAGDGLFDFVQILFVSNGTNTRYFSRGIWEMEDIKNQPVLSDETYRNLFGFTSQWADQENNKINDLEDFAETFLTKKNILSMLLHYTVMTQSMELFVLRPHQIAAIEALCNRAIEAKSKGLAGTIDAGGYFFHAPGAGKTMTGYVAMRELASLGILEKVLFCVDRRDLDSQTLRDFNNFSVKGVKRTDSSKDLKALFEDPREKLALTTTQKLSNFAKSDQDPQTFEKNVAFIFDECHRSQSGEMSRSIRSQFKNYYIFGCTGTPIYAANAYSVGGEAVLTTKSIFGDELHTYTMGDSQKDGNTLKLDFQYRRTMFLAPEIEDKKVKDIDRQAAYNAPERIKNVSQDILEHFGPITCRNPGFRILDERDEKTGLRKVEHNTLSGNREPDNEQKYNAIFTVSSTISAQKYYKALQALQKELPEEDRIRIGVVFCTEAKENESFDGEITADDCNDPSLMSESSREFMASAMEDYNKTYGTSFSMEGNGLRNYYDDLCRRVRNCEIELVVVVNMMITGYNAPCVNTIFIDRWLKDRNMMQAACRTNRLCGDQKTAGNIIMYRDNTQEVAMGYALYANAGACGDVLSPSFEELYYGYTDAQGEVHPGYLEMVNELKTSFPLPFRHELSKEEKEHFMDLFRKLLRKTDAIATKFEFKRYKDLSRRDTQDYMSIYRDYRSLEAPSPEEKKEYINDDLIFGVAEASSFCADTDYIEAVAEEYEGAFSAPALCSSHESSGSGYKAREKSKIALLISFVDGKGWVKKFKTDNDDDIISVNIRKEADHLMNIIKEENLYEEETMRFMADALRRGMFRDYGSDIDGILPSISRFAGNTREETKKRVVAKLREHYDIFSKVAPFMYLEEAVA